MKIHNSESKERVMQHVEEKSHTGPFNSLKGNHNEAITNNETANAILDF
jgi:hypothetical protein